MDFVPGQFNSTTATARRGAVPAASDLPTPIEIEVKTEYASIKIKGADGLQVSDTLHTVLAKLRRSNNNGDALIVGLVFSFVLASLVIISLGSLRRTPSPEPKGKTLAIQFRIIDP